MTTLQLQSSEFTPKHHESTLTHVRQSHFHSDGPNDQTDSLNITVETVSAAAAHPSLHQTVCVLHLRSVAASILVAVCVYTGCMYSRSPVRPYGENTRDFYLHRMMTV